MNQAMKIVLFHPLNEEGEQEGSTGNDRVAGASTEFSTPMLFGYAPGVVDGNGAVGPFFYSGTADGAVGEVEEVSSPVIHRWFRPRIPPTSRLN